MNFNIVDGENDFEIYKEDFLRFYNNPRIRVATIPKRMGISESKFRKLRTHYEEIGLITLRQVGRPRKKKEPRVAKHIHKNPNNYKNPCWNIRRNGIYYCCTTDYRKAEEIVEKLEQCNWDKTKVKEIKAEVMG